MAKPLGPKSKLIREAIGANSKLGNTELAELINSSDARKEDKLKVTANDVANQRLAMKKAVSPNGAAKNEGAKNGAAKKRGPKSKKAGGQKAANHEGAAVRSQAAGRNSTSPVKLIDRVFDLAEEVGGFGELKRLVDRIAGAGR